MALTSVDQNHDDVCQDSLPNQEQTMSVYALKPKFQALLRPLVQRLAQRGISANQVTLLACGLSILIGLLISLCLSSDWLWGLLLLPIFLFVRMAMNAIDGMLAREHAQQ